MRIEIESWNIEKIVTLEQKIDPKPQYQRGSVWSLSKNALLIDSILRSYDIPKIYLRKTSDGSMYDYEVADGQQRLRAIWEFVKNNYKLEHFEFGSNDFSGYLYKDLPQELQDRFRNYKLTMALVVESTNDEIRTLFSRLQMGERLTPPELRNAIASAIGNAIDSMVKTHRFFKYSNIPNKRFKHQDYLSHAVALIHYKNNEDLKANLLKRLYEELSSEFPDQYMTKTFDILDRLHEINQYSNRKVIFKWGFVDLFWLLYRNYDKTHTIDSKGLGEAFLQFENKRKKYSREAEILIESEDSLVRDKDMYTYIQAFRTSGALKENIKFRNRVFSKKFGKFVER